MQMSLPPRKTNASAIVEEVSKATTLLKDSMPKLFSWGSHEALVTVVKNNFLLDKCWYITMEASR